MPYSDVYRKQVELLMASIPFVAEEECFALKGGTAINFFVRNLPRLSVDIDLTYLPVAERKHSLAEIHSALIRIGRRIKKVIPSVSIKNSAPATQKTINKLVVRTQQRVQIKIEVTPVLRGCVYNPQNMVVGDRVEDEFGFAEINVLSFADLYAGKIMAALDRQHPRDLFDVYHLFENEGITEEIRVALIVYLISHDHSPHSLLSPRLKDIGLEYEKNFIGMTNEEFSLKELLSTRAKLIEDIHVGMTDNHKEFLFSFYRRDPEWERLGLSGVNHLPAVKWRELNLDRAGEETQSAIVRKLEDCFGLT